MRTRGDGRVIPRGEPFKRMPPPLRWGVSLHTPPWCGRWLGTNVGLSALQPCLLLPVFRRECACYFPPLSSFNQSIGNCPNLSVHAVSVRYWGRDDS
ncbi:MAG: hypothetical protein ACI855_003111 [Myxococcota bacterium]|jgi:hypothetical protein